MDKEKGSEIPMGYKKPPIHTRFKPGQSGNPSGRPKKKAATIPECIERELDTLITVNEGGTQRRITKVQAIVKQLTNKAAKGDPKATALVMRAVEPQESEQADGLSPLLQVMRAIHANHEVANQNGSRATAVSELARNSASGDTDGHNEPD